MQIMVVADIERDQIEFISKTALPAHRSHCSPPCLSALRRVPVSNAAFHRRTDSVAFQILGIGVGVGIGFGCKPQDCAHSRHGRSGACRSPRPTSFDPTGSARRSSCRSAGLLP